MTAAYQSAMRLRPPRQPGAMSEARDGCRHREVMMRRMRRLARHLFTLCSAASLLLCVVVCVLWVRSYGEWDSLFYAAREDAGWTSRQAYCCAGELGYFVRRIGREPAAFWHPDRAPDPADF